MTDHADLRTMLEALPAEIQWEPNCGRIEVRAPDGLSHAQMDDLMSWLLRSPALVRALLAERDELAERDASAKRHAYAEMPLRAERDSLRNEVKMWRSTADSLKADRDQLAKRIEDQSYAPEWLSAVDEALGEDRKKAPFIDDAVTLLRKERDAILAENRRLLETNNCLKAERDALKAEVERLRAAQPSELARLFAEFRRKQLEQAHPAEPISDELRLRCELAATVFVDVVDRGAGNDYSEARIEWAGAISHVIAERIIAEGRRRMAAEREGKP